MKITKESLEFFGKMYAEVDNQITVLFHHKVKNGQAEGGIDWWETDESGTFEIHSSSYCCGDSDIFTTYISSTELLNSEEAIRAYEEEKKQKEEIKKQLEAKRVADKAAADLAKEKAEFLRLQKKFGDS